MTGDDPRHGTYAGYVAGCRCAACSRANARYHKRLVHDHANGRRRTVDATGFWRRVRALQAIGWPLSAISAELGILKKDMRSRHPKVSVAKHLRMVEVYRRMENTPGPSVRSVKCAERHGWPPPIAWDYDTLDDPQAQPYSTPDPDPTYVDQARVHRILRGEWSLAKGAPRADRLEVQRLYLAAGGSAQQLGKLTGWNVERDKRWLRERSADKEEVAA